MSEEIVIEEVTAYKYQGRLYESHSDALTQVSKEVFDELVDKHCDRDGFNAADFIEELKRDKIKHEHVLNYIKGIRK